MSELNISKTAVLERGIEDYSVSSQALDTASSDETTWDFPNAQKNIGYYKSIPELKKAIDALADWTTGRGYSTDAGTKADLDHIQGNGKDTFQSVIWNLQVMKKVIGDAFAEIITKDNILLNLKPISAERMRAVYGKNGLLKRYEYKQLNGDPVKFKPEEILHLVNDRVGDEIHGVSVVDACQWVIDARNEAMTDYRKVLHRNVIPVRIIEIDTEETTKRDKLMAEYKEAIQKGEVLVIPKGTVSFGEDTVTIENPIVWIQYLENFFYMAVGIPRVILGGTDTYTEASSKMATMNFDQVWESEQAELEQDLWNQLGIKISFERPASLIDTMQSSEAKNTGQQQATQPNDFQINNNKQ